MMNQEPDEPTTCTLEVLVMPNGEILCYGRTIGWLNDLGRYLDVKAKKYV